MIFCRKCCVSAHFYVHRPVCFYYRAFRLTLNKSYSNHKISFKSSNSFPTDRFKTFFLLCWGLTTCQPLCVICCRLLEKGRREIEEIVEEMKERDMGERKMNEREETEEIIPPLPLRAARIAGLAHLILNGIKTIIKCGTWQPVKFHLVSRCWNEMIFIVSAEIYPTRQSVSTEAEILSLVSISSTHIKCMNGEQTPVWYFVHAQDDLNAHFAHVGGQFYVLRAPNMFSFRVGYFTSLMKHYNEHKQTQILISQAKKGLRACAKSHPGVISSLKHLYSIKWFRLRTAKAMIRRRGCSVWPAPSLSTYVRRHVFGIARPIKYYHKRLLLSQTTSIHYYINVKLGRNNKYQFEPNNQFVVHLNLRWKYVTSIID